MRHAARICCLLALGALLPAPPAGAQVLPDGFSSEFVVGAPFSGMLVGFTFLPDDRTLIIERNSAAIRLSAVGSNSSSVIHTVPNVESGNFEQGLLGIAVDPAWPVRPYLYVYYTHVDSTAYLTMYEASGDLSVPGSTAITLSNPYNILTDLPDVRGGHNGGTLHFAADGMLFLSIGDDQDACLAQDTTAANGSILRLDVSSMPGAGSGPPPKADITPGDNPFPGPDPWAQLMYAWGFRNPWKYTIDPLTGDLWVGDVGLNSEEEVDIIPATSPGANYGWPQREGMIDPMCCGTCGQGNTFVDPVYSYPHDELPKSVIGGPVYRAVGGAPANLPPSYEGTYFFCEWFEGWIRRLEWNGSAWQLATPVAGQPSPENWAEDFSDGTDFQVGPDGALYFLKSVGQPRGLVRIYADPSTGTEAVSAVAKPVVSPNPASVEAGTTIRFDVARRGAVSLRIVDVTGRRVRDLVEGSLAAGSRTVRWDGRTNAGEPAATGTYFWRLETAGEPAFTGKISLVR